MTPDKNNNFYLARRALERAMPNTDRRDNTPATAPAPEGFPPDMDTLADTLNLQSRGYIANEILREVFSGQRPAEPMRVAATIHAARAIWQEISPGHVQLDPRWEAWLARFEATGIAPPYVAEQEGDGGQ